jgi:hypothetical protein
MKRAIAEIITTNESAEYRRDSAAWSPRQTRAVAMFVVSGNTNMPFFAALAIRP